MEAGTNAISCGCAAFGPAVAVEPLGSWILHQWKMKGPPILERFNKISSGQLLPESISLVAPISGKLGQQDCGCLKRGGFPQLRWERGLLKRQNPGITVWARPWTTILPGFPVIQEMQPKKAPLLSAANCKPWLCWTLNLATSFSCFQPDFPEKASESQEATSPPHPTPSSENKQAMLATERLAKLTERSNSNKALGGC